VGTVNAERTATGWCFALFLALYLLVAGGHYGGDGFWNYLTAESIVLDGDLVVGDRPFLIREMVNQYSDGTQGSAAHTPGRRYSKYGIGMALVEVPFYAAGVLAVRLLPGMPRDYVTMFAASLTNVVVCALWGALFFSFSGRLGHNRRTRLWLTGAFGLGTMVFPYSGYGFSEPLVGLCLLGSATALCSYRHRPAEWRLVVAGGTMGLAIATKSYAIVALPLLLAYVWPSLRALDRKVQLRHGLSCAAPLAAFALLVMWYNWARYGGVLMTGYHLDDLKSEFWTGQEGGYFSFSPLNIAIALYGFLLSSGRGLVFFLPTVVLLPIAVRAFHRRHPRESVLFASLVVVHLLLFASFRGWHGGSCWGPRYLLPIVPCLVLPLGPLFQSAAPSALWARGLALVGGLVNLPAALTNHHLFIRFVSDQRIGDLIYFPHDPGDLLFTPGVSPVLGAYCQLTSALSAYLTGAGIRYPVPSGAEQALVRMDAYHAVDIWWVNALRTGYLSGLTGAAVALVALLLVLASVVALWKLSVWRREPASPHGGTA